MLASFRLRFPRMRRVAVNNYANYRRLSIPNADSSRKNKFLEKGIFHSVTTGMRLTGIGAARSIAFVVNDDAADWIPGGACCAILGRLRSRGLRCQPALWDGLARDVAAVRNGSGGAPKRRLGGEAIEAVGEHLVEQADLGDGAPFRIDQSEMPGLRPFGVIEQAPRVPQGRMVAEQQRRLLQRFPCPPQHPAPRAQQRLDA